MGAPRGARSQPRTGGQHSIMEAILASDIRTAISKSTIFSANVDMSLEKQNLYSPWVFAVKTKSPCLSFSPSRITLFSGAGPVTL